MPSAKRSTWTAASLERFEGTDYKLVDELADERHCIGVGCVGPVECCTAAVEVEIEVRHQAFSEEIEFVRRIDGALGSDNGC